MKLMPVAEAKKATDAQTQTDIIRANEAKTELKSALSELEKAEASFKLALANQQIRQINEETSHGKTIKALIDEIKTLEKKRAELLIPIGKEREEAHTMFIQAEDLRRKNRETEIALDEKSELLDNKIDDASEQLEMINRRTAELNKREQGIKQQEEMTKKYCSDMTAKINEKVAECLEQEKQIAEKKKELQFKEWSLKSEEDNIKGQYEFISKEKIRLTDREQTLERELERIQNGNNET